MTLHGQGQHEAGTCAGSCWLVCNISTQAMKLKKYEKKYIKLFIPE